MYSLRLMCIDVFKASVSSAFFQVCVEVLVEYPFFVFGQGWSSCCPDRTTQLFELSCAKLCVGDVCVSLTLRSLKNGSVTDSHTFGAKLKMGHIPDSSPNMDANARNRVSSEAADGNCGLLMKASGAERMERQHAAGSGGGVGTFPRQGEGIYTATAQVTVEARQESSKTDTSAPSKQLVDQEKPSVRKRRWSAPERDQTERAEEEEPPVTLPKPSFIPQEVKISIEGHSSSGSEMCANKRVNC